MKYDDIISKGLPNHIAIILDGNGRYAKQRMLPRSAGHYAGAMCLKDIALFANSIGLKYLTAFCFSTENWKRSSEEVNYLMKFPIALYKKNRKKLIDSNIKISFIGRRDRIPADLLDVISHVELETKSNTGLNLILAVDYGSIDEVTMATKKVASLLNRGAIKESDITFELIKSNMYTSGIPDPDLLIRTSGEERLSNFLLIQLAYAEIYFTKTLWPSFSENDLMEAIANFQLRKRNYGGRKETKE